MEEEWDLDATASRFILIDGHTIDMRQKRCTSPPSARLALLLLLLLLL